uniref:Uncharacterized protein n=1 Tax=Siphoviridae sp. ctrCN24 TaxID=2827953 RepID=A0A8S5SKL3_9CAUD|nr:MAG TPA: hypothetical protein [Siphoviridae sp. ctrCN24]
MIYKSYIFLPALASGFTPPQGDSRWGFLICICHIL